MNEEQITNRYVRGMISLEEFRAEMVAFYDREDAKDRIDRITSEAYAKRELNSGDPIANLVRLAVRIALADAKAEGSSAHDRLAIRKNAINEALDLLTAHELYRYRPKAFDGFIEYARTTLSIEES